MPLMRSDAAARHAMPGGHLWRRAAYSRQSPGPMTLRDGLVGARYLVPGEHPWHRAAHSRVTMHGTRNASHTSPLTTRKLKHFAGHTMPSKFPLNFMKTTHPVSRRVTPILELTPPEFSAFRGLRR
jgi:hypothetical protein